MLLLCSSLFSTIFGMGEYMKNEARTVNAKEHEANIQKKNWAQNWIQKMALSECEKNNSTTGNSSQSLT